MDLNLQTRPVSQLSSRQQTVHIVEGDIPTRAALAHFLRENGFDAAEYDDQDEFLSSLSEVTGGCLVISADEEHSGIGALQAAMPLPVIFVSEGGDVKASVEAMKSGAVDFLLKPLDRHALLRAVGLALDLDRRARNEIVLRGSVRTSAGKLTRRERQVFEAVTSGLMNKQIAYDLGISEIMVKVHRGRVMKKMNSRTLPDLVRKFDILQLIIGEPVSPVPGATLN